MIKIRILDIEFENPIEPWEIAAFRGAVIESAGRNNTLFHNHLKENYRYSYPLIQYKRIKKRPHLFCIEEGVDEVDKEVKLRIKEIKRINIISVKGVKREAFTLTFNTNVFLPNYIGLGKNASLGFGVVKQVSKNNEYGKS